MAKAMSGLQHRGEKKEAERQPWRSARGWVILNRIWSTEQRLAEILPQEGSPIEPGPVERERKKISLFISLYTE